jgi:RHS repeat-associated protein
MLIRKIVAIFIFIGIMLHSNAQVPLPGGYPNTIKLTYVREWAPMAPITNEAIVPLRPVEEVLQTTNYVDGLGRPLQSVTKQASPLKKDIVNAVVYDEYGREIHKYLPFPSTQTTGGSELTNNGAFKLNPFQQQQTFMNTQYNGQGETYFYSKVNYESSPLNRPIKTFAPGNNWVGSEGQANENDQHGIKFNYRFNTVTDDVKIWSILSTGMPVYLYTTVVSNGSTQNVTYNWAANQTGSTTMLWLYRLQGSNGTWKTAYAGGYSSSGSYTVSIPVGNYEYALQFFYSNGNPSVMMYVTQPGDAATPTTYINNGSYAAGTLFKNITADETGKKTVEFKDKQGKILLKKVQIDNTVGDGYAGWLCTYYIYDDFGQLRMVLPPKATATYLNGTALVDLRNELAFIYEYDLRGRMIIKKVPGAAEVYMVYDANDRLIMTQDGNLRTAGKWMVTTYDALDRPKRTGLLADAHIRAYHMNQAQSNSSYPDISGSNYELLTENYYDDYSWVAGTGSGLSSTVDAANFSNTSYYVTAYNSAPLFAQVLQADYAVKGLATGSKIKVLGTINQYLYNVVFYDEKGRALQTQSINITGGKDITTTQYDFSGKPLRNLVQHQKAGTNAQTHTILTKMEYDHAGRLLKIKKTVSSVVGSQSINSPEKTIAENTYDELGQLKTKKLAPEFNSNVGLEQLKYDYNIRGWLLGVNRDFAKDANSSNYFGFDLGYDKANNNIIGNQTYTNPQYNGNIEGMVWKSKGDGEKRKYDFNYDNANRLLAADFNQYTGSSFNKTANVDFSVKMGDGINPNSAYDANGNILGMNQKGLLLNTSNFIDQLNYTYQPNSNKLQQVIDNSNDKASKLGDFKYDPVTKTLTDYTYDVNGNLVKDNNKRITGIRYNHLNLPEHIEVTATANPVVDGGSIDYTYDALGNKLMKKVTTAMQGVVAANRVNTTTYIGGLVYERNETIMTITPGNGSLDAFTRLQLPVPEPPPSGIDILQFIAMEEGRIRFKPADNNAVPAIPAAFAFDYFIKDHLGNVRMVLTDEQQVDKYPVASLEPAKAVTEKNYYDIQDANVVDKSTATGISNYINDNGIGNNPADAVFSAANSTKLYRLNSNTAKTGLGITLKVMAGDKIDVLGKSYYFQNSSGSGSNNAIPITDILNAFLNASAAATATAVHGTVTAAAINTPTGIAGITNIMNQQGTQSNAVPLKPKAFINVIFFDEQFKAVDYRVSMVGNNSTVKDHYADLQNIAVPKNGFVYIYCSNESPVNVYFDNLQVVHTRGPILEETHYYPFGLTMAGISNKAAGGVQNHKKFVGQEFDEDLGLNLYQFKYRNHDPQIGRFIEIDPLANEYVHNSTYAYAENRPIDGIDLEGLEWYRAVGSWIVNQTIVGLVTNTVKTISSGNTQSILSLITYTGAKVLEAKDVFTNGTPQQKEEFITTLLLDVGAAFLIPKLAPEANAAQGTAKPIVNESLVKAEARAAKLSTKPRPGEPFTKAGKEAVIDVNKAKNDGQTVCENCGTNTTPAKQSQKGVSPPKDETQVDHVKRRSEGGSGTPDNGQVLCRGCNLEKH